MSNYFFFLFFLRGTPLSSSFTEMFYERYVSKEDDRAARSPDQSRYFQNLYEITVLPPQFSFYLHLFNLFLRVSVSSFFSFLLLWLFLRYFFLARSRARFACRSSEVILRPAVLSTFLVQSRTREIARSSHGIKYATERVDCYRYILSCRA